MRRDWKFILELYKEEMSKLDLLVDKHSGHKYEIAFLSSSVAFFPVFRCYQCDIQSEITCDERYDNI